MAYESYLKKQGYDVTTTIMEQSRLVSFKEGFKLPREAWSCHTAVIDGYVVEGHVPVDVIEKLETDGPDIDGISLPGMPLGTPGMPGKKLGPWTIHSFQDGRLGIYNNY